MSGSLVHPFRVLLLVLIALTVATSLMGAFNPPALMAAAMLWPAYRLLHRRRFEVPKMVLAVASTVAWGATILSFRQSTCATGGIVWMIFVMKVLVLELILVAVVVAKRRLDRARVP